MHESQVGGYLSVLQVPSCPLFSPQTVLYIFHHDCAGGTMCSSLRGSLSAMIALLLQRLYMSFRRHGQDGGGGRVEGIGGWSEVGASLKSDKLLKIAFTQPFLFGHTCHIWMWYGNKSAVAEGSAPRVVPHITQTPRLLRLTSSLSSSTSSGWICKQTAGHPPIPPNSSLCGKPGADGAVCWC